MAGEARAERPAEAIQDNSFLVEEAYNQQPGVVQHIFNALWTEDGVWALSLTQEWPLFSPPRFSLIVPTDSDDVRLAIQSARQQSRGGSLEHAFQCRSDSVAGYTRRRSGECPSGSERHLRRISHAQFHARIGEQLG